jgi:hypothetical protein
MRIYEVVFTLPFPIELWPETNDRIASHQSTTVARNMQWLRAKLKRQGVNLKLLRVCKAIRKEATRCFYECNEWRFSGTNGWMVANAFLYSSSLSMEFGWQHIRSITLPLPFDFTPAVQQAQVVQPAKANRAVLKLAKSIPFAIPAEWRYEGSVSDVLLALGKCDNLKALHLVLPEWYDTDAILEAGKAGMLQRIARLRGRGVKIWLVRLSSMKTTGAELIVIEGKQRAFVKECRARGWDIFSAQCDKLGIKRYCM